MEYFTVNDKLKRVVRAKNLDGYGNMFRQPLENIFTNLPAPTFTIKPSLNHKNPTPILASRPKKPIPVPRTKKHLD